MASELKVDKITGVTTAGSIDVTGEGNSTTTNLQQGLVKSWNCLNGTGTIAVRDSFNVSSIVDITTGSYRTIVTNNLVNSDYATMWEAIETVSSNTARSYSATESANTRTTSANACRTGWTGNNTSGSTDPAAVSNTINGDLA